MITTVNAEDIVRDWKYREVFSTEHNISFGSRKSDKCDWCLLFDLNDKANAMTDVLIKERRLHITSKNETRAQRTLDRQNTQPETTSTWRMCLGYRGVTSFQLIISIS